MSFGHHRLDGERMGDAPTGSPKNRSDAVLGEDVAAVASLLEELGADDPAATLYEAANRLEAR